MYSTIPEITKKYIGSGTLQGFADSLGINASRQSIHQWKEGTGEPSIMTLFRVIGSETATPEAKEWARECINVLTAAAGVELEDTLDKEVERRR